MVTCLILTLSDIILQVLGFALENVAAKDFEEHGEPEVVQTAHYREENTVQLDEGLELGDVWGEVRPREDKPDHLRQTPNPRHKPRDHARDEGDGARVLKDRGVEALRHTAENVCDIVQVSDDGTNGHDIAEDVAEVKTNGSDMV